MKKVSFMLLTLACLTFSGCDTLKGIANNILNERDAITAIKEMLTIGANGNALISKDALMSAILPKDVNTVLQKLQQLGLSKEVDKFTNTLTNAASQTATNSIPVFVNGIKQMSITDAIGIVKNGGTAATDYLRSKVGDSLRTAVTPVMKTALDQYNITKEWDKLVAPVKLVLGNKVQLNLNIDNLLAGVVTNAMFSKIAEQEVAIRTKAEARTTPALQRVFGRDWNNNGAVK
jgi:predicted small secreted protein